MATHTPHGLPARPISPSPARQRAADERRAQLLPPTTAVPMMSRRGQDEAEARDEAQVKRVRLNPVDGWSPECKTVPATSRRMIATTLAHAAPLLLPGAALVPSTSPHPIPISVDPRPMSIVPHAIPIAFVPRHSIQPATGPRALQLASITPSAAPTPASASATAPASAPAPEPAAAPAAAPAPAASTPRPAPLIPTKRPRSVSFEPAPHASHAPASKTPSLKSSSSTASSDDGDSACLATPIADSADLVPMIDRPDTPPLPPGHPRIAVLPPPSPTHSPKPTDDGGTTPKREPSEDTKPSTCVCHPECRHVKRLREANAAYVKSKRWSAHLKEQMAAKEIADELKNGTLRDLERIVAKRDNEIAQLRANLAAKITDEAETKKVTERNTALQQQNRNLFGSMTTLMAERRGLEAEKEGWKGEREALEKENKRLEGLLRDVEGKAAARAVPEPAPSPPPPLNPCHVEELKKRVMELAEEARTRIANEVVREAARQAEAAGKEEQQQADLGAKESEIAVIKADLAAQRAERETHTKQNADLQQRVNNLEIAKRVRENDLAKQRKAVKESQDALEAAQQQVAQLVTELESQKTELVDFREQAQAGGTELHTIRLQVQERDVQLEKTRLKVREERRQRKRAAELSAEMLAKVESASAETEKQLEETLELLATFKTALAGGTADEAIPSR